MRCTSLNNIILFKLVFAITQTVKQKYPRNRYYFKNDIVACRISIPPLPLKLIFNSILNHVTYGHFKEKLSVAYLFIKLFIYKDILSQINHNKNQVFFINFHMLCHCPYLC